MSKITSMAIEFNKFEKSYHELGLVEACERIKNQESQKNVLYWIHCNLTSIHDFHFIVENLNLPSDFIDLLIKKDTSPKLIDDDKSLSMCIQGLVSTKMGRKHVPKFENLTIHLTTNYCLSFSNESFLALHDLASSYQKIIQYAETPCSILFILLDNIINDYSTVLYHFEIAAEKIDLQSDMDNSSYYEEIVHMKKQVMKIKRNIVIIRNILMRITGRKIPVISDPCRLSLVSLYEHCKMIGAEVEAIRDTLNGFLAQIDNGLMYRMNESISILTAFAAIFLPLTVITGIYGMNFRIPELSWHYGYYWALGLMVTTAVLLIYIFKKKRLF